MQSQPQLRKYQQMGFSAQQIQTAAKTARERKVDILDVLLKAIPEPANPRSQPANPQARPQKFQGGFKYRPYFKPKNKLNLHKYNCIYTQEQGESREQIIMEEIRDKGFPPVLQNVSNCCYLNSLLMAYYLMPELVKLVMKAVPLHKSELDSLVSNNLKNKRIQNSYNLLHSLQALFSKLTLSTKKTLNPSDVLKNLVDYFGNKIAYGEEKDLNEMNYHFISRLQESLYYTRENLPNLQKEGVISSGLKSNINQNIRDEKSTIPELNDILFGTKIEISTQGEETQTEQSQFLSFLLNPIHGTLYKCLDEEFHYEINDGGSVRKKDVWIVKQPEYLFFYFQRTGFEKDKGATKLKNRISFDFKIYLDRYLHKNKEAESKKSPALVEHTRKREELLKEIGCCKLLIKSLEECHQSTKHLAQRVVELPSLDAPQRYLQTLQSELKTHEKSISQLESRKDPYDLKYIILHRGSISSGHYWGYGYSGNWWRYDLENQKVSEETIMKQIDNGDIVVYALIYTRSKVHINPSFDKFLRVPDPDLLSIEEYYDWIDPETQLEIVAENNKREQVFEERRIWESFEQITLEYDEMICEVNRLRMVIEEYKGEQPYLSSFAVYLRSLSRHPSASFKLYCLDSAIKKVTKKYSLIDQPNQRFSNHLKQVIKNNISQENIPDKFKCSKFDMDKLKEKELEYYQRVKMRLLFNLLFQNLRQQRWRQSVDCAVLILAENVKDSHDYNYAREILSVLIIKLHHLGQTIPVNYMKCLEAVNQHLNSKISEFVSISHIVETEYTKTALEAVSKKLHQTEFDIDINRIHFDSIKEPMMELKSLMDEYKKKL